MWAGRRTKSNDRKGVFGNEEQAFGKHPDSVYAVDDAAGCCVCGRDGSGVIYGCRELIDRVNDSEGKLNFPEELKDGPEMVLRGACVGLQKMTYLPGHGVYEYPYTPESFPWFYDKEQWIKYLDMLDRKSTRLNSSHKTESRMPSSA